MRLYFEGSANLPAPHHRDGDIQYQGGIGDYVCLMECSNNNYSNSNGAYAVTRALETLLNIPGTDRVTSQWRGYCYLRPLPPNSPDGEKALFCYKYMKQVCIVLNRMRTKSYVLYTNVASLIDYILGVKYYGGGHLSVNTLKASIVGRGGSLYERIKQALSDSITSGYSETSDRYLTRVVKSIPNYRTCGYVRGLAKFVDGSTVHPGIRITLRSRTGVYVNVLGTVYYTEHNATAPEVLFSIMVHKDYKLYYNMCVNLGVKPDPSIFKVFVRAGFDVVRSPHTSMRKFYRANVLKACKEFNIPIETVDNFKALFGSEGKFVFKSISERKKYEEDLSFDLLNTARTRIKLPKMERPTEQRVEVITKEIKSENLVAIDGVTIDLSQFM